MFNEASRSTIIDSLIKNCQCYKKAGSRAALNKMSDSRLRSLANNMLKKLKTNKKASNADPEDELGAILDWVKSAPPKFKTSLVDKIKAAIGMEDGEPLPSETNEDEDMDGIDDSETENEDMEDDKAENEDSEEDPTENEDLTAGDNPPADPDPLKKNQGKGPTGNKKKATQNYSLQHELSKLHPEIRRVVNASLAADVAKRKELITEIISNAAKGEKKSLFEDIRNMDVAALERLKKLTSNKKKASIYAGADTEIPFEEITNSSDSMDDAPIVPTIDWTEVVKEHRQSSRN